MKHLYIILLIIFSLPIFAINIDYAECDKVVYKPGETVKLSLRLKLTEKSNITTILHKDINTKIELKNEDIDPQNDYFIYNTTCPTDKNFLWGYNVEFIIKDSKETKKAFAYFACGDRPYIYGHYATVCNRGYLTKQQAEDTITLGFKVGHYGAIELFSWEPSMWETMAPKEDEWFSGQMGYIEKKENIQAIINKAQESGVDAFSYHAFPSWGYAGSEYLRQHAEWWNYDKHGKPFPNLNNYDTKIMENMANMVDSGIHPLQTWWETGNLVFPGMLEYYLDQLKKSDEMFHWNGYREDGLAWIEDAYNSKGELVKADPKLKDKKNFAKYVRQWIKDNLGQDKTIHFNCGSVYYPLEKTSKDIIQTYGEDNSYILWEGSRFAFTKGHELNDMRIFAKYGNLEVSVARECGGYRYCYYEGDTAPLIEAIVSAVGAKAETYCGMPMDPPRRWTPPIWRDFTFRFSKYFWDNKLIHVEKPEKIISIDKDVFWEPLVQKKIDKDKTYYIVHMLNHDQTYSLTPEKPNEINNINVQINTNKKVHSYVISPDFGAENSFTIDFGETNNITVPSLKWWDVIIFEINSNK